MYQLFPQFHQSQYHSLSIGLNYVKYEILIYQRQTQREHLFSHPLKLLVSLLLTHHHLQGLPSGLSFLGPSHPIQLFLKLLWPSLLCGSLGFSYRLFRLAVVTVVITSLLAMVFIYSLIFIISLLFLHLTDPSIKHPLPLITTLLPITPIIPILFVSFE